MTFSDNTCVKWRGFLWEQSFVTVMLQQNQYQTALHACRCYIRAFKPCVKVSGSRYARYENGTLKNFAMRCKKVCSYLRIPALCAGPQPAAVHLWYIQPEPTVRWGCFTQQWFPDDRSHSVPTSRSRIASPPPASSATQLWSLHPCRRQSAEWKTVSDSRGCRLVRGELNTSRSRTVQTCRDAWRRAAPELSLSAVFSSSALPAAECKSDWLLVISLFLRVRLIKLDSWFVCLFIGWLIDLNFWGKLDLYTTWVCNHLHGCSVKYLPPLQYFSVNLFIQTLR